VTDYHPGDPCPCEVPGCVGSKLSFKTGHVSRGCICRSCIGRRNRKKGQAGEARRHRRLGGVGTTPRDELAHCYSINVTTEDKVGKQIPASFRTFIDSEKARVWFRQAEKKLPIGNDAFPALYLELSQGQAFLVVKLDGKTLR
jgi:hypothetical protein